jgi:hypothetical protein
MIAAAAFNVVGAVAQGMAGRASAMSDAARQDSEARLADTQALQRDTLSREDLGRYLSTVRAARAANGLGSDSPNALLLEKEATEASDRDRLLQRADDRQRASNFRLAAQASRSRGKLSLLTGVAKAGVPLARYGAYKGWGS